MHAAFPRSEYYGGSAPPAPSAGVVPIQPPSPWNGLEAGTYTGGSHVHCSSGRRVRHPALPLRYRHGYCRRQFTVASKPRQMRPSLKFPASPRKRRTGAHRKPARIHRVRAGELSRDVTSPVPRVYLPVSLTAPGPSGSAEPTRLCRGCSRPPRRPPAQASSSFTPPLRRRSNGRSLTSIRNNSASWRTISQLEQRIRPRGQAPVQAFPECPQRQVAGYRIGHLARIRGGRRHQREPLPARQCCENMVIQRLLP